MPIDLKEQYFGTEIEMTGIRRERAARVVAELFGTSVYRKRAYDSWCVKDQEGKEWKFSSDSSIPALIHRENGMGVLKLLTRNTRQKWSARNWSMGKWQNCRKL